MRRVAGSASRIFQYCFKCHHSTAPAESGEIEGCGCYRERAAGSNVYQVCAYCGPLRCLAYRMQYRFNTGQQSTGSMQLNAVQCGPMQLNAAAQCSRPSNAAVQCSSMQPNAAQCSSMQPPDAAAQCNAAVQCSSMQLNAAQCSPMQLNRKQRA